MKVEYSDAVRSIHKKDCIKMIVIICRQKKESPKLFIKAYVQNVKKNIISVHTIIRALDASIKWNKKHLHVIPTHSIWIKCIYETLTPITKRLGMRTKTYKIYSNKSISVSYIMEER